MTFAFPAEKREHQHLPIGQLHSHSVRTSKQRGQGLSPYWSRSLCSQWPALEKIEALKVMLEEIATKEAKERPGKELLLKVRYPKTKSLEEREEAQEHGSPVQAK